MKSENLHTRGPRRLNEPRGSAASASIEGLPGEWLIRTDLEPSCPGRHRTSHVYGETLHHSVNLPRHTFIGGSSAQWDGPVPGSGCEVFISHFPRETFEDRLIPLFSAVGPLWEFRLMMNFSGQTRGFAYAKYGTRALAAAAVSQLHGHELEPGIYLNVRHSTEKRQLCVLMNLTQGVEGVSLKSGPDGVSALVMYVSHHAASMAKKALPLACKKATPLPLSLLRQLDRAEGGGGTKPLLKLVCVHVDLGRSVSFAYEAHVPGLAYPLRGTVATVLSDDTAGLLDEVHRLATGKVLAAVQALACEGVLPPNLCLL
ncbi:hypothetical protein CRUP_033745 [Coryphaenoides rupestris]|nr:hypothetical protein CRUP_033745 [Coryphaenoides rupestris]